MKTAGVVILYYPDDTINDNILSYLSQLRKLYIFDNSEKEQKFILTHTIVESSNVHYFHDGKNHGIAESLNIISKLAISEGYSWLLTMDQDSNFTIDTVREYFTQIQNYYYCTSVAMFGVQYLKNRCVTGQNTVFAEVNTLITSGSMVNLECFNKIGGFNERLFIDEVDLEYCFRAVDMGFKIVQCTAIYLNHRLGIQNKYRSFKNFKITQRTLHTPVRIYYMVRNHLYVNSKFKTRFKSELNISRKALINRLKNNIIYSSERLKVIKYIFKGIIDFKQNRMGKLYQ